MLATVNEDVFCRPAATLGLVVGSVRGGFRCLKGNRVLRIDRWVLFSGSVRVAGYLIRILLVISRAWHWGGVIAMLGTSHSWGAALTYLAPLTNWETFRPRPTHDRTATEVISTGSALGHSGFLSGFTNPSSLAQVCGEEC